MKNSHGRMPTYKSDAAPGLLLWCYYQKKNKSSLSPDKIKQLNALGFNWDKEHSSNEALWEKNYNKFVEFLKNNSGKYPKQNVNGKYNHMYFWFKYQQQQKSKLSSEKIKQLNSIGFNWENLNRDAKWEKQFNAYLAYKKTHAGNILSFLENGARNPLSAWCLNQKKNKDKLSDARLKKLSECRFCMGKKNFNTMGRKVQGICYNKEFR